MNSQCAVVEIEGIGERAVKGKEERWGSSHGDRHAEQSTIRVSSGNNAQPKPKKLEGLLHGGKGPIPHMFFGCGVTIHVCIHEKSVTAN